MKNLELPSADRMSAAARAAELTTILSRAIVRTLVAEPPLQPETPLGFLHQQSVHTTPDQLEL